MQEDSRPLEIDRGPFCQLRVDILTVLARRNCKEFYMQSNWEVCHKVANI